MYQWCAEKWRVVLRAMISGGSPPIVECLRVEESTVRSGAPVRWDFLSPQNARENRTQDGEQHQCTGKAQGPVNKYRGLVRVSEKSARSTSRLGCLNQQK